MEKRSYKFNTKNLNNIFNIEGEEILYEEYECNLSSHKGTGNPFYGKKHTEETKLLLKNITLELCKSDEFRMSRSSKGEKNGMYGVKRCKESNPMWGKKHSEEAKEKQREKRKEWFKNNESPLKGKPCPEKTKKILSEKNSKEYKLISPEGKIVEIKNLTKFARDNELSIGCLQRVVSGRNKSHRGWKNGA